MGEVDITTEVVLILVVSAEDLDTIQVLVDLDIIPEPLDKDFIQEVALEVQLEEDLEDRVAPLLLLLLNPQVVKEVK
jgi:hypothetical protein